MIKNALAISGSYADVWGMLKSFERVLIRARSSGTEIKLTEFDRERLAELAKFLKEEVVQPVPARAFAVESLRHEPRRTTRTLTDLRERIRMVPSLDNWQTASKMGFDRKVLKLAQGIDEFLKGPEIFPSPATMQEFEILADVISTLLLDIEVAV